MTGLYQEVPSTGWQNAERPEWSIAARWLKRYSPNRRVLDVGCFRGDFLQQLGDGWDRAGIEPSHAAAEIARGRGIRLIAPSLFEIDNVGEGFGAITLFDVLEHFRDPLDALRRVTKQLNPNGILIISTGTTDAWAWKLLGADYWYCSFPEHLAFINSRWIDWASRTLALTVLRRRRFSHETTRITPRLLDGCFVLAYQTVKVLKRLHMPEHLLKVVPILGRAAAWTDAPATQRLYDHLLLILRKNP